MERGCWQASWNNFWSVSWGCEWMMKCTDLRFRWGRGPQFTAVLQPPLCTPSKPAGKLAAGHWIMSCLEMRDRKKTPREKKINSFVSVWIIQCLTRTWIPSRQLHVNSQADENGWKKPTRLRKQYDSDNLLNRRRTRPIVVRTEDQQQANLRLLIKQSVDSGKMK